MNPIRCGSGIFKFLFLPSTHLGLGLLSGLDQKDNTQMRKENF
jgi:hypothetical protein